MGDKSILKHISQKESCRKDYNEEDMEYLRNWADKRIKSRKSKDYERNKPSIKSKRSDRYKKEKEKKKEETRKREIEHQKLGLENMKEFYEKRARSSNSVPYSVAKQLFPQVFVAFRTFDLSEEDSQTISGLENSIEEKYQNFEREIDRIAKLAKELKYERGSLGILTDMYSTLLNPNYQIQKEWHKLRLKMDLSLKEIATKMGKPYVWADSCHCEECTSIKNINGKGKGKKSKK